MIYCRNSSNNWNALSLNPFISRGRLQPIFLLGREVHRINRVAHYISCVVNPSNTSSCLVKVQQAGYLQVPLHKLHESQYESQSGF